MIARAAKGGLGGNLDGTETCNAINLESKMGQVRVWLGTPPAKCDLCNRKIMQVFIDGRTTNGRWGIMCPTCRISDGVGLGTGKGQQYRLNLGTKQWEKTQG